MALARKAALDIDLGAGEWTGGVAAAGVVWFINNTPVEVPGRPGLFQKWLRAYNAQTGARLADRDIALAATGPSTAQTRQWRGSITDGTTLWTVGYSAAGGGHNPSLYFVAHVAATGARNSTLDFNVAATLNYTGGACDHTTAWLVSASGTDTDADAYRIADRARLAAADIDFAAFTGPNMQGGAGLPGIVWFLNNKAGEEGLRAFTTTTSGAATRAADSDVDLDASKTWTGAAASDQTVWAVNDTDNTAVAYNVGPSDPLIVKFGPYTVPADASDAARFAVGLPPDADGRLGADNGAPVTLEFSFGPDTDTLGHFAIRRTVDGTVRYWTGSTWSATAPDGSNLTTLGASGAVDADGDGSLWRYTLPATWDDGTSDLHEFAVLVYNTDGSASAWGPNVDVLGGPAPALAVTVPAADGDPLLDENEVDWTSSLQEWYRARLVDGAGRVWADSLIVDNVMTRHAWAPPLTDFDAYPTLPAAGSEVFVDVTVWSARVVQATVRRRARMAYTPPTPPAGQAVDGHDADGFVRLAYTPAAPAGGAPPTVAVEVRRRRVGDTGPGDRIVHDEAPTIGQAYTHDDHWAPFNTPLEYRALGIGRRGQHLEATPWLQ